MVHSSYLSHVKICINCNKRYLNVLKFLISSYTCLNKNFSKNKNITEFFFALLVENLASSLTNKLFCLLFVENLMIPSTVLPPQTRKMSCISLFS